MDDGNLQVGQELSHGRIREALARAAAAGVPDELSRAFLRELSAALAQPGASWEPPLAAEALGSALRGRDPGDLARIVLGLARGLEDALEDRQELAHEDRRRLEALVEHGLGRALSAHEDSRRGRRDGWLSFYTHELRNPLNTLVNAIWLLRQGDKPAQAQRICDMAERAVKKLENTIREVRELEQKFAQDPPRRPSMKKT